MISFIHCHPELGQPNDRQGRRCLSYKGMGTLWLIREYQDDGIMALHDMAGSFAVTVASLLGKKESCTPLVWNRKHGMGEKALFRNLLSTLPLFQ